MEAFVYLFLNLYYEPTLVVANLQQYQTTVGVGQLAELTEELCVLPLDCLDS